MWTPFQIDILFIRRSGTKIMNGFHVGGKSYMSFVFHKLISLLPASLEYFGGEALRRGTPVVPACALLPRVRVPVGHAPLLSWVGVRFCSRVALPASHPRQSRP